MSDFTATFRRGLAVYGPRGQAQRFYEETRPRLYPMYLRYQRVLDRVQDRKLVTTPVAH
jgi:hypothetical protein